MLFLIELIHLYWLSNAFRYEVYDYTPSNNGGGGTSNHYYLSSDIDAVHGFLVGFLEKATIDDLIEKGHIISTTRITDAFFIPTCIFLSMIRYL